jgi:arabinogalactan oligomer / maltooligosaccharide transport system substrate-binding protein
MVASSRAHVRLLTALLLCLLTACGPTPATPTPAPPGPTASPKPAPRPTAPPPVTNIPEPAAAPSALTLWVVATGPQLEAVRRLVADLSRPPGVEVVVVGKSADGLLADVRADVLAGRQPPDLIWGTQDELGLLQRDGVLQPAADRLDDAAFIPATIVGATIDRQRWGTPLSAQGSLLLLYNRRLVDQPPKTTDELIASARNLTTENHYGLVAGWAEPRWFVAWLAGFGGTAIGPDGSPTLDTPQTIAALDLLKELRTAGPPPPSTYAAGVMLFKQGNAAFAIDGDWALEDYRAYSETLDLGIAPMPIVPATGRVAAPPLGGSYLMYSKALAGERLDQARVLAVALAQPSAQARIARDLDRLPALRAALADPAVVGDPALAAAAAQTEGALGLPPSRGLRCAWEAIRAELPPLLLGELAQADAARNMQNSATACLARPG